MICIYAAKTFLEMVSLIFLSHDSVAQWSGGGGQLE